MKKRISLLLAIILLCVSCSSCSLFSVEKKLTKAGFYKVESEKGMYQNDSITVLGKESSMIASIYPEQSVAMVTLLQEFDDMVIIYSLSCESKYMIQKILYDDEKGTTSELVYDYESNNIISDVIDRNNTTNKNLLNSLRMTYEGVLAYLSSINLELSDFITKQKDETDTSSLSNETKLKNNDFTQDSETGAYVKEVTSFGGKDTYYTVMINLESEGESVKVVDNLSPMYFNYVFNFKNAYVIFNVTTSSQTVLAEGIYDIKNKECTYYSVMKGYEKNAVTKQDANIKKIQTTYTFITSYLESIEIDPETL